jgi:cyclopropane-fatty-acyl-phospholipid synthase
MKSVSLASPRHLAGTVKPSALDWLARRLVLGQLQGLQRGLLSVVAKGQAHRFGAGAGGEPAAQIVVADPRFYSEVAFGGSIGGGEAFMHGYWQCDDLVALVRLLLRNRAVLDGMEGGAARFTAPLRKLFHWVNRNTHDGARRNIAAHYDLGNEFFALWLDETMMYSSAIFEQPELSLHEAQLARLDRRLCAPCRAALRLPRHDDDDFERTAPVGARAGCRGRSAGPHRAAAGRLSGPQGPIRQARLDRDDRGHRP